MGRVSVVFSLFFILSLFLLFAGFSAGFHIAEEVLSGNFTGTYNFTGTLRTTGAGYFAIDSGSIGIGTTSPSTKLHVNGTTYTTDVIISNKVSCSTLYTDSSGNVLCGSGSSSGNVSSSAGEGTANYLPKFTNSSTLENSIIYDDGSQVGINRVPAYTFDVASASEGIVNLRLQNLNSGGGNDTVLRFSVVNESASNYIYFGDASDSTAGYIRYDHGYDRALFYANNLLGLSIDAEGQVGVGRGSSSYDVDILGREEDVQLRLHNNNDSLANDAVLRFQVQNDSAENRIYFGDSSNSIIGQIRYEHASDDLIFRVNGSDRLVINGQGEVGIGDTSPDASLLLDVEGQIGATEFCDQNGANCFNATNLSSAGISGTGSAGNISYWSDSDTLTSSQIYTDGTNIGINTSSPDSAFYVHGGVKVNGSNISVINGGGIRFASGSQIYDYPFISEGSNRDLEINVLDSLILKDSEGSTLSIYPDELWSGASGFGLSLAGGTQILFENNGTNQLTIQDRNRLKFNSMGANTDAGFDYYMNDIFTHSIRNQTYGINVTNPDTSLALDIGGDVKTTGNINITTGALYFSDGTSQTSAATGNVTVGAGGGTANNLSYWINSTSLASSAIYDDGTGDIGIGTESPVDKLHVQGGDVRIDGTNKLKLWGDTVTSASTLQMYVESKYGKAHIHTQMSGAQIGGPALDVYTGNAYSIVQDSGDLSLFSGDATGGTGSEDYEVDTGNVLIYTGSNNGHTNASTGDVFIYTGEPNAGYTRGNVILGHDGTTSAGNVGIGTNSPKDDLQVGDRIVLSDHGGNGDIMYNAYFNGSTWLRVDDENSATLFQMQVPGDQQAAFYTATDAGTTADSEITWSQMLSLSNTRVNVPSKLSVSDTTPDALFEVSASGGSDDLFFLSSNDDLDGDIMAVFNNGTVGIGDTSPDASLLLDVEGQVGATEFCDQNGANCFNATNLSSAGISGTGSAGNISYWSDSDTLTSSQLFESSGNIGIGSVNPNAPLEVNGSIYLSSNSDMIRLRDYETGLRFLGNDQIDFLNAGALSATFDVSGGNKNFYFYDANLFEVRDTSNDIIFRVDTGGNIGIGNSNPNSTLDVSGDINISLSGASLIFPDGTSQTSAAAGNVSVGAGGGTANNLSYWINSTSLASSAIYDDGTGDIGIGTESPVDKLHVQGGDVRIDGTNKLKLWGDTVTSASTLQMYVESKYGKAHIHTQMSGAQIGGPALNVYTGNAYSIVQDSGDLSLFSGDATGGTGSEDWEVDTGNVLIYTGSNNGHTNVSTGDIFIYTGEPNAGYTRGNIILGHDASSVAGNVGIGNSNPNSTLDVSGDINISLSGASLIFPDGTSQTSAATGNLTSSAGEGTTNFIPYFSDSTTFADTTLEFDSSTEHFGIGLEGISPAADIHINDSGDSDIRLMRPSAPNNNYYGYMAYQTGLMRLGTNKDDDLRFLVNGVDTITIDGDNGDDQYKVGIGTDSPDDAKLEVKGGTVCVDTNSDNSATECITSESDIRLKKNIVEIQGALDKLEQIRGVEFDWRWDEYEEIKRYKTKPHSVGIIAQEVEKVFPEAMGQGIGEFKTVEYKLLVPPLIEAVKELRAEKDENITQLREEISSLKEENAVIKEALCLENSQYLFCN